MAITDFIALILTFFLVARGASRGFLNSLINPFSIIITTALSILYYAKTGKLGVSLMIGLLGPILLAIVLKISIRLWSKAKNPGGDARPNFFSRATGAFLTVTWGWILFAPFLLLLLFLPPFWGKPWTQIHNDIAGSLTYSRIIRPFGEGLVASITADDPALAKKMAPVFANASKPQQPVAVNPSNPDAQALSQDPRFQKVLQDPDIQEEINNHDYVKLMANPKIMNLTKELMADPTSLKKVLTVYSSQAQGQPANSAVQASQ